MQQIGLIFNNYNRKTCIKQSISVFFEILLRSLSQQCFDRFLNNQNSTKEFTTVFKFVYKNINRRILIYLMNYFKNQNYVSFIKV